MKKILLILSIILLFSCNSNILMNNGEIIDSGSKGNSGSSGGNGSSSDSFTGEAPTGVNATKSYYSDKIVVRWSSVKGADYYSLEKAAHSSVTPSDDVTWSPILETVTSTSFEDDENLSIGEYYSYRVTAHSLSGDSSKASSLDTGTILASPVQVEASKGTSSTAINLIWDQMPNVESYKIYKSESKTVSGVDSEYVTTVSANYSSLENAYAYSINEREGGIELSFAIQGVGPTGSTAKISLPRTGYTYVEGAPLSPDCSFITKADSTDTITIKFKSSGDVDQYVITRSAPGSAETTVFDSEVEKPLETDEDGYFIFEDSSFLNTGVEYTYNITARNDIGISKATTVIGYLLSPAKDVKLVPVTDSDKIGYNINFTQPVGYDDPDRTTSDYKYIITEVLKNGNERQLEKEYLYEEINEIFFEVSKNATSESEKTEIRKVKVQVKNEELLSEEIAESASTPDISAPVENVTASRNAKPSKDDKYSNYGVYPVYVKWNLVEGAGSYNIIITGSDNSVREVSSTENSYVDGYEDSKPFVSYTYYVYALDPFGRYFEESKNGSTSEYGYGAIYQEVYAKMFESISLKPWDVQTYVPDEYKSYWKNSKIATLVGYGNSSDLNTQMKALDDADDKDHYRSDSKVTYSAKMQGVGAKIVFTYNRFGENLNWWMTGDYTMDVDASGTGSASSSSDGFTIEGWYPGHVSLAKISVKGKNFSGKYVIKMQYSSGENTFEVTVK